MSFAPEPIDGRYVVDTSRPLEHAGGGLPAFSATDLRSAPARLMAVRVNRSAPIRARAFQPPLLAIEGLLCPLGHGIGPEISGDTGYFVISPLPPGPPLSVALRAWSEAALIEQVLRPVARVLEQLRERGLTHRAIRPNNVFQGKAGECVVLGSAWAAPAGRDQPLSYEPPYSGQCLPVGRGDGTIADDVYALGVLLLTLVLGREPETTVDPRVGHLRKLERGSAAALIGNARLPSMVADLVRGMLAEDPEHRPSPQLLLDPTAAPGRRVAARPPRRAQNPFRVGILSVSNARMLAFALAEQPDTAAAVLRGSAVMQWLRRDVGDPQLAVRLEELQRIRASEGNVEDGRADTTMTMRAVAMLDPLAPLCWRGLAIWPSGVGPALAASHADSPAMLDRLVEIVATEAVTDWAVLRSERCDLASLRMDSRLQRGWLHMRKPIGGVPRLIYMLNPFMPCASTLLGSHWVSRMTDLLSALDIAVAENRGGTVIDGEVAAFVTARADPRLERDITAMTNAAGDVDQPLAMLRLLSDLQGQFHPRPLPALAGWMVRQTAPLLARWRNPRRRALANERLQALGVAGMLPPILAVLDDPASLAADAAEVQAAKFELMRLDAELMSIAHGGPARSVNAALIGQEIAAGIGLTVLAFVLLLTALG